MTDAQESRLKLGPPRRAPASHPRHCHKAPAHRAESAPPNLALFQEHSGTHNAFGFEDLWHLGGAPDHGSRGATGQEEVVAEVSDDGFSTSSDTRRTCKQHHCPVDPGPVSVDDASMERRLSKSIGDNLVRMQSRIDALERNNVDLRQNLAAAAVCERGGWKANSMLFSLSTDFKNVVADHKTPNSPRWTTLDLGSALRQQLELLKTSCRRTSADVQVGDAA